MCSEAKGTSGSTLPSAVVPWEAPKSKEGKRDETLEQMLVHKAGTKEASSKCKVSVLEEFRSAVHSKSWALSEGRAGRTTTNTGTAPSSQR